MNSLELNQVARQQIDNVLMQYHIVDPAGQLMVTFAPAGEVLTQGETEKGKSPWGFDFFKKQGINILAFSAVVEPTWYRSAEFRAFLRELAPKLTGFSERLGYGASMGAYAVGAFADVLGLDRTLMITPVVSLNREVAPHENRWQKAADNQDWSQDSIDASDNRSFNTIVFDPFCPRDKLHARYFTDNTLRLSLSGVGHNVIESLAQMGQLKNLVSQFVGNTIDPVQFAGDMRSRRNIERYYSYMKRNPTGKMSKQRQRLVRRHQMGWQLRNVDVLFAKVTRKWGKSLKRRYMKMVR